MALCLLCGPSGAAERTRPNVVFILADDLGWNHVASYGSKFYKTPHIDALAKRGLKFTQAYSASPLHVWKNHGKQGDNADHTDRHELYNLQKDIAEHTTSRPTSPNV